MSQTFAFRLIEPSGTVAEGEALSVVIPGREGEMTILPGHAPTVTQLDAGTVRIVSEGGDAEHEISGGFAGIFRKALTILVDGSPKDERQSV